MITKFKLFERLIDDINVGDWIITHKAKSTLFQWLYDFMSTHVGYISEIDKDTLDVYVQYYDIPEYLYKHFDDETICIEQSDIKYYGTKKEMEMKLKTQDFNL